MCLLTENSRPTFSFYGDHFCVLLPVLKSITNKTACIWSKHLLLTTLFLSFDLIFYEVNIHLNELDRKHCLCKPFAYKKNCYVQMLHIGLAFLSLQEVQHGVMIAFTSTLQKLILVTRLT